MSRYLKSIKRGAVFNFRDRDASPAEGASLWELCPLLAVACDPVGFHQYHDDFTSYVAGDWTVTESGDGTQAITDEAGGVLLLTNAASDDNSINLQKVGEAYKLASGKALWYETRLKISDATQSDFLVGLAITDTTLIGGKTDGVSFRKADGATAVSFVTEKDSTETTTASVHTQADATYARFGFFFDGNGSVYGFVNGLLVATHTTNIPDDEDLRVSFAIQNGEAVAKTMSIDFVKVVQVR